MPTIRHDDHFHEVRHYPAGHLAAVLRDEQEAEQTAQALHDAGFADVLVVEGPRALQAIEATEHSANPLTRVWEWLSRQLSEEVDTRQEAQEALRRGHALVLISVADRARLDQAEGILTAHQAHALRLFGRWTITDLRSADLSSRGGGGAPEDGTTGR